MPQDEKQLILVVDDQAPNLQLLANILKQYGYSLALAQSGDNALNFIQKKHPDLILLDVMMPEMDGFEVCRRIKANPETAHIPIIFITAKTDSSDIVEGFSLGAVDYIAKPFDATELLARTRTHLELKKSKDLIAKQNAELEKKSIELGNANAAKDKFLSIIGHDLKNMFNSLLGPVNLLTEGTLPLSKDEEKELMQMIRQSAIHGHALLTNLYEWARAQSNRIEFHPMPLKLSNVINHNIEVCMGKAMAKKILLSSESEEDIDIYADMNMLDTVLRNLIGNAIKFTPENGKIRLSYKKDATRENKVTVCVEDNGVGIEPENLEKLFAADSTLTTPGTNKEKGTGLGLLLCKEFIRKHGGDLRVESTPGEGSRFYIDLNIVTDDATGHPAS